MNPVWSQQGRLQPQATGWQQPMLTGYPGGAQQQQQQSQQMFQPPPPPQRPMQTGYMGMSMNNGNASLMPQATGFPGYNNSGPSQPQQSMMLGSFSTVPSSFLSTFMPSNPNASWGGNTSSNTNNYQQQQQYAQQQHIVGPSAPPPPSLPQYFQQHNQQTMGQSQVQVQWSLTADERRNYDKIFRAWDLGSGYIDGNRATDVFKESGLEREDLMKIW